MRTPHRLLLPALAVAALIGLSGCVDNGFPFDPEESATPSDSVPSTEPTDPGAEPSQEPSAEPSEEPTGSPAIPVAIDCESMMPIALLYEVDPNLALVPISSAPAGSLAAQAAADRGSICSIVHTSRALTVYIGLSQPASADTAAYRASAGTAIDLGLSDVQAYQSSAGVQVFGQTTRFTVESSAADPDLLIALAKAGARAG